MTLRLVSPPRYQLQAVDPVGRSLWSLDVADDAGLWLNHRNRTYCRFAGKLDLSGVPLGPFPLLSLPSLLLGRVPAEPAAGSPTAAPRGRTFDFRDETNRHWYGNLGEEGLVTSWTLAEGSTPKVWWLRREDWAILSDRERNVQVRWREVLRESLGQEPPRLEPPAGYRQTSCGEQEVPGAAPAPPEPSPPEDLTPPPISAYHKRLARPSSAAKVRPDCSPGGPTSI